MNINIELRLLTLTFHSYPSNANFGRVNKYRVAVAILKN
jgi:hypothetical protein